MKISTRGTKGFFLWMREKMPDLYQDVRRDFSRARQLSGIGIAQGEPNPMFSFPSDPVAMSTTAPASKTLAQTIQDIANVAAQAYLTKEQLSAQRKILDVQLQRAQQGLPPLDIDPTRYGLPQPSIAVGMSKDTKQLLIAGGAIAAVLFVGSQVFSSSKR